MTFSSFECYDVNDLKNKNTNLVEAIIREGLGNAHFERLMGTISIIV